MTPPRMHRELRTRTSGSKEGIMAQKIQRCINIMPVMSFEIYFVVGRAPSMNRKIVLYYNKYTEVSLLLPRFKLAHGRVALFQKFKVQLNTIQYNAIQYNTIQYNAIQYNTMQYNTIWLFNFSNCGITNKYGNPPVLK